MRGQHSTHEKNGSYREAPRGCFCPLSGHIMYNPVMLVESGYTFEESAIVKYLEHGNRTCPVSKMPLSNCSLVSNFTLKNCVDDWLGHTGGYAGSSVQGRDDDAPDFDWIAALLEEQLKGTYKGWDDQDASEEGYADSEMANDRKSIEKVVNLLYESEETTQQAAALSLGKLCWGCESTQSYIGGLRKGHDGIIHRLTTLLLQEVEDNRPGYMAWALAELCRGHTKNQMRLEKVDDIDILSILFSMLEYGTDVWVVRAARLIAGWCNANLTIQNLVLEANFIQPLVNCLQGGSTQQKTHAGLALLHICHRNNDTSMQAVKCGALQYIPQLLTSGALTVRAIGAGLTAHLLSLFDYTWGPASPMLINLVNLVHQVEEYASAVAAAALFEIIYKEKSDMVLLMEMNVVPKIIDLLHKCPYPGYRRCTHKFLLKWAKFVASQRFRDRNLNDCVGNVLLKINELIPVSATANKEVAVHVVFTVLPFADYYKHLLNRMGDYEMLSMDATISSEARSMCHSVVSYVRKVEVERRGRLQVILSTAGVVAAFKLVKFLGKGVHRGWYSWF